MYRILSIFTIVTLLAGCMPERSNIDTILTIADAENLHFTAEGRLFVSGHGAVWEVVATDQGWQQQALLENDCDFTGLASDQDWLYAACTRFLGEHALYVVRLVDGTAKQLTGLADFFIPNGMSLLPDGSLLLADEDFFSAAGAARIQLQATESWPEIVAIESQWLGGDQGVEISNGTAVFQDTIYLTDGGAVKKLELDSMGQPGLAQVLLQRDTVLDDLSYYCDGVLVTDFFAGQLVYVNTQGELLWQSEPDLLRFPSAVQQGQPPLFEPDQLLVTEKGILGEKRSDYGNALLLLDIQQLGLPEC